MANNEQLAKKGERDSQVLRRYREQWEKLKAGARKKEQERLQRRVADAKPTGTENGKENADDGTAAAAEDAIEGGLVPEADFGKA